MKTFWKKVWQEMHREPTMAGNATLSLVGGLLMITLARYDFEPNPNRPPAEFQISLGCLLLFGSLLAWLDPVIRVRRREKERRQQLKADPERQKSWYDEEVKG